MLIFVIILAQLSNIKAENYTWSETNRKFDFVVGITVDGEHLCPGIIISAKHVLTAANPVYYMWQTKNNTAVEVHWLKENKTDSIHVSGVLFQFKFLNTSRQAFGDDGLYSPLHDIASLTLLKPITLYDPNYPHIRHPEAVNLYRSKRVSIKPGGNFTIVGFAFKDKLHLKKSNKLVTFEFKVESVLTDCDEWMPRQWGYFFCILNVGNFIGIDAGAALLHNDMFVGMGSFSLIRGTESILLFTDIRKYKTISSLHRFGGFNKNETMFTGVD